MDQTMETKILGRRNELDKFLAFAAEHAHKFVTMEYFRSCGRKTDDPRIAGYEVGHVDRPALMKAYVQHVFETRQQPMRQAGFTLIELLIGIVALAGIGLLVTALIVGGHFIAKFW